MILLKCKIVNINLKLLRRENFMSAMNSLAKTNEVSGSIVCKKNELNLGVTLKGGQSFRWIEQEDGNSYRGVFSNSVWTLSQSDEKLTYTVHGSLNKDIKYDDALFNYFRLNIKLQEHIKGWSENDPYFESSHNEIGTVRMLNQDAVENLFSAICTANNNIKRISGMVEKMCRIFGKKICQIEDQDFYDFPLIEALADSKVECVLKKEGFGYRSGYIAKTAQKLLTLGGKEWLSTLKKDNGTTYEQARENLMSLPGIGPKVADFICLMSLGHLEAIPVDTHIFQIACAYYMPHLSKQKTVTPKIHHEINSYLRELWGPLAGWAQTIVFCEKINSTVKRKNKKRASSQEDQVSVKVKSTKKLSRK